MSNTRCSTYGCRLCGTESASASSGCCALGSKYSCAKVLHASMQLLCYSRDMASRPAWPAR